MAAIKVMQRWCTFLFFTQDKAMDAFRGEYEKLFAALEKSHKMKNDSTQNAKSWVQKLPANNQELMQQRIKQKRMRFAKLLFMSIIKLFVPYYATASWFC